MAVFLRSVVLLVKVFLFYSLLSESDVFAKLRFRGLKPVPISFPVRDERGRSHAVVHQRMATMDT